MVPNLYRFRRADAILGFKELARQEIYFAPSEKLNDPMEGYKDVFWSGDLIVWRNLLRHYLLCLLQSAFAVGGNLNCDSLKTLVSSTPEDLPSVTARQTYEKMCDAFRADANIQLFLETLSARSMPVRREELKFYLRSLHPFALSAMVTEFEQRGIKGIFRDLDAVQSLAATTKEALARVETLRPAEPEVAEDLFLKSELDMSQRELLQDYKNGPSPKTEFITFLVRNFPASYVRALDELIHPPCLVACFVADEPTADSSMWAKYGDDHKGVCLKFKTVSDKAGRPTLNLKGITGWHTGTGIEMEPIYSFTPRTFYKVNYARAYPEIDFFNSIARLPIPIMNSVWYKGENGELSSCRAARSCDTEVWRQEYWEAFQAGSTCKTLDWQSEREYRLMLWYYSINLNDDASRKLQYNFADLSGIIFGTKTTVGHKLEIMRIIEEKCKTEGRRDFEFYQIQYSRRERAFRCAPLDLIRF